MRGRYATDEEGRRLALATQALDAYLTALRDFTDEVWSGRLTEIPTGKPFEDEMVRLAFTYSGSYVVMATDHLLGLRHLVAGKGLPNTACYTLIRGCAEAAVRSSWLSDLTATTGVRVLHAISERLANVEAHHKVLRNERTHDASRYVKLRGDIVSEALKNGVPTKPGRNPGDPPRADIPERPRMTDLMDQQLRRLLKRAEPQSWYYALLSSHAHSVPFTALFSSSLGDVDADGLMQISVSANVEQILEAVDPALGLLGQAARDFGQMVGNMKGPPQPGPISRL